jgi:hypothetical protein
LRDTVRAAGGSLQGSTLGTMFDKRTWGFTSLMDEVKYAGLFIEHIRDGQWIVHAVEPKTAAKPAAAAAPAAAIPVAAARPAPIGAVASALVKPPAPAPAAPAPAPAKVAVAVPVPPASIVTDERLSRFLAELQLSKYLVMFEQQEVTFDALLLLSTSDLGALGLPMGPRILIQQRLPAWNQANLPPQQLRVPAASGNLITPAPGASPGSASAGGNKGGVPPMNGVNPNVLSPIGAPSGNHKGSMYHAPVAPVLAPVAYVAAPVAVAAAPAPAPVAVPDGPGAACPPELMCPFGSVLMRDPVEAADGRTYQRDVIELWLQHFDTSPVTGQPLAHKMLRPNAGIQRIVNMWLKTHA